VIYTVPKEKHTLKEENNMKTTYSIDNKRISRKALTELIGKEQVDRLTKEAKETFLEDPLIENDIFIGKGMLTIRFS
jgi:hypothetical protein